MELFREDNEEYAKQVGITRAERSLKGYNDYSLLLDEYYKKGIELRK